MDAPYELYIALRYLRFHRGRTFVSVITFISVLGVAVGVAALVIALSLNAGFAHDIRERIYSSSAHLTVLSAEAEGPFTDAPELIERVEAIDGVHAAAAVLQTSALVSFEPLASHSFTEVQGVDPLAHARVVPAGDERPAALARLVREQGQRPGIVLGQTLARRLGAIEGDTVRLLVPRVTLAPWGGVPRSRSYDVVATYASDHFQEDSTRAYLALDEARSLMRSEGGSSWIDVRLDDVGRLATMRETLRDRLAPRWLVVDLIEQNREILRALNTERLLLFFAIGLIVVVAALNIVSLLILLVNDKVREIGTLAALGARPGGIARVFMAQGLVIGTVGTALGLALGWGLCRWLDAYRMIPLDPEVYYMDHLPFRTGPGEIVWVGVTAILVSFVATIYPARRAAGLDPVEAIRHE